LNEEPEKEKKRKKEKNTLALVSELSLGMTTCLTAMIAPVSAFIALNTLPKAPSSISSP
jgi:hypothetical protein